MSEAVEKVLAALEAHALDYRQWRGYGCPLTCGWVATIVANGRDIELRDSRQQHRAHVAAMLEPVLAEVRAEGFEAAHRRMCLFSGPDDTCAVPRSHANPYRAEAPR